MLSDSVDERALDASNSRKTYVRNVHERIRVSENDSNLCDGNAQIMR